MTQVNQNNFLYTISKIRQRLFTFLEDELAKENITDISPSYGDVLYILGTEDAVNLRDISRLSYKDKSTITGIINRLEKSGYVIKKRNRADKRLIDVQLTEKALNIRPALQKISGKLNSKLFSGLSEQEKTALFQLMSRVNRNAG